MNELWHRIWTRMNYFIGFLVLVLLVVFFLWRQIDPEGSAIIINDFLSDLWEITKTILAIAIVFVGILIMFGRKPFSSRKG